MNCDHCGEEFELGNRANKKYCSSSCQKKAQKRRWKRRRAHGLMDERNERVGLTSHHLRDV